MGVFNLVTLRVAALATIGWLAVATPAKADGVDIYDYPSGRSKVRADSFQIGLEGQYYQYREPRFVKLDGYGGGVDATYSVYWGKYFLKANAIVDYLDLDYSSNGTGSNTGNSDWKMDFRGLFGYDFRFNRNVTFRPYTGLGYRLLIDSHSETATTTGDVGYDRRSQYLYAPFGAAFGFHLGKWGFSTFAEYDYLIQGWQTSYLRDVGFDNNVENNQSSGYGIRGNLMVRPPINFYNFSIGPYARYWNIHNSDSQTLYQNGVAVGSGVEPANNTLEVGLQANITFQ